MTGKTAIVFTCAHSSPEVDNERFKWLGELIYDVRPDLVVDLGDFDDMKSLNSYDTRYPQAIVSQNYQRDIEHGQEARELLWKRFKEMKRKRPFRVGFEGNHEYRIKKAIAHDPRLEGEKYGISPTHLQTDYWYDEYHEYTNSAPAIADYAGVSFAHYFASGNYGTPVSGTHHAYTLLQNRNHSSTCGHSHKRSMYFKDSAHPHPLIGLVAGCFKGSDEGWAGQANNEWWKGVVIKRELDNGTYEPQFVSLASLGREYGER